jgi:GAF domain-containing protein
MEMSSPERQQQMKAPTEKEMFDQLNEFLAKLPSKLDKEAIIAEAVFQCKNMMSATATSIFLLESDESRGDQNALHLIMSDCFGYDKIKGTREGDYKEDDLKKFTYDVRLKTEQGLTALIAQERKSILITSRDDFEKQYKGHHLGKFDNYYWENPERIQSFIGVPLIFSADCIGVLKVESDKEGFYEEKHKTFMENLAIVVAAALNSATVFDELTNALTYLASSSFAEEILLKIVESCAHLCHAEAASLLLYDQDLNGLLLRADYGHDKNLSNVPGTKAEPRKFVYDPPSPGERAGITWKCYEECEPKELNKEEDVRNDPAHANKIWPDQWNDPNKRCHSVYMTPIIREKKQAYGVLKVENKLDLMRKPVKVGGFTENDKSLVKIFTNALSIHLKDPSIYFDMAYIPEELFGKPILELITKDSFKEQFKDLNDSEQMLTIISDFFKNIQRKSQTRKTLAEYTHDVLIVSNKIANELEMVELSESLLKVFRDYEIILKHIPGYRLHFLHQFNVFLLGLVMIANAKALRERFATVLGKDFNETFLKEWFIASMFHDIGVTIEKQDSVFHQYITDSLNIDKKTVLSPPTIALLSIEDYYRIYPQVETSVVNWFDNDDIKEAIKSILHQHTNVGSSMHSHALVSACMVARALRNPSLKPESINRILSSIALHDLNIFISLLYDRLAGKNHLIEEAKTSIVFLKHPLWFLLSICDLIQNYGRPELYHFSSFAKLNIYLHDIDFSNIKRIIVELRYSERPEDWEHIFKNIIKEQANVLHFDDIDLEIIVEFRFEDGRVIDKDYNTVPISR